MIQNIVSILALVSLLLLPRNALADGADADFDRWLQQTSNPTQAPSNEPSVEESTPSSSTTDSNNDCVCICGASSNDQKNSAPAFVPTVSPTTTPSITPSSTPSTSPSSTPSSTPSLQPNIATESPHNETCYDVPGWYAFDNVKFNCDWFSKPLNNDVFDDYYQEEDTRCGLFGDIASNTENKTTTTASTACCICGGGYYGENVPSLSPTLSASPTYSPITSSKPSASVSPTALCFDFTDWMDSGGGDCAWYERPVGDDDYYYGDIDQFSRCKIFGADYANLGFVANQACCVCGGGTRPKSPSDMPSISDMPSVSAAPTVVKCYDMPGWYGWNDPQYDCAWFDAPVNNFPGDDYYEESDTRCAMFGNDPLGVDAGGYTASTACCVCGGGYFGENIPSVSPTTSTEPTVSSAPSNVPSITASPTQLCFDFKGWSDSGGGDCAWYERPVGDDDDYYDDIDEFARCKIFGADHANNLGFVANQACCVCGGGIRPNLSTNTTTTGSPTLPPTSNVVPIDAPSDVPSVIPSDAPSIAPSDVPSDAPSDVPNVIPSDVPSIVRSDVPSDAPSSIMSVQPTVQNCYDVPGWFAYNNPKFDCAWFASPVNNFPSDDYYDDSDTRCVMFGGADSTSGGYTALTACCTCGGGVLGEKVPSVSPSVSASPTVSSNPSSGPSVSANPSTLCFDFEGWTDSDGVDCVWYEERVGDDDYYYSSVDEYARCDLFGADYENMGFVANQACCFCGGGTKPL